MKDEQLFINLCDVLLNQALKKEVIFNEYLLPFLENEDFDAFITMYALVLNKFIKSDMDQFRNEHNLYQLPMRLKRDIAEEYSKTVASWLSVSRERWAKYANCFIQLTEEFYNQNESLPTGMKECMECVRSAFVFSASRNDEEFERNWYQISTMFAVGYRHHIKEQMIKEEYVERYKLANQFVETNGVFLPYVYVLVWDIFKIGTRKSNRDNKDYQDNRERIKENILRLPKFYRDLICVVEFYPEEPRERVIASGKGKDGTLIPIATTYESVPFYDYLPCFIQKKEDGYRDYYGKSENAYHPMTLTKLPCTDMESVTDVALLVDMLYYEASADQVKKQLNDVIASRERQANSLVDPDTIKEASAHRQVEENIKKNIRQKARKMEAPYGLSRNFGIKLEKELEAVPFGFNGVVDYFMYKKDLTVNEVVDNSYMSKPTFYRHLRENYKISKEAVLAITLSLKPTLEEAELILSVAGFSLSDYNYRDIVIKELIKSRIYDVYYVNYLLKNLGLVQLRNIE